MSEEKQGLEKVPEDAHHGNQEFGYESDHCSMEARDSMDSFFTVRVTSIRELDELENSQPNSSKSQKNEEGDHHVNLSTLMGDHVMNVGDHFKNLKSSPQKDQHVDLNSLMGDHHINRNSTDTAGAGEGSCKDLYPQEAYTEDFGQVAPRNSTEIMNYKPCCMPICVKKTSAKPNNPSFTIHANQKREEKLKLGFRATFVQKICFARKSNEGKLPA